MHKNTTTRTKVFHTSPTLAQLKAAKAEGFAHVRTPYLPTTPIQEVIDCQTGAE